MAASRIPPSPYSSALLGAPTTTQHSAAALGLTQSATDNVTLVAESTSVLRDISSTLWHVMPLVLMVFGTFGNVMTVVVMRGMRGSKSTACLSVYFTALAVSDQFLLTMTLVYFGVDKTLSWPSSFYRFDLLCVIPRFVWCTTEKTSAWFLVALTFQRVIAVVSPHRVGVLCTARTGKLIVVFTLVMAVLFNGHLLFTWSYWPDYGQCQYRQRYMGHLDAFGWLDLACASMVPFVFLAAGNGVLLWQVGRAMRLSRQLRGDVDEKSAAENDKVHAITRTLVLTSATFLVLTLPACVMDLFEQLVFEDNFTPLVQLVNTVFDFLWISAAASNFYLYLLSGSKFRQETKRYLCYGDPDHATST